MATGRRLNLDSTGVLFFDMLNYGQRNAERGPAAYKKQVDRAVANAVRIMKAARRRKMPLFYTKPDHRPDNRDFPPRLSDLGPRGPWPDPEAYHAAPPGSHSGTLGAQIIDELAPLPEDTVALKHRWSSFHQTPLELSLRTAGVDTIALIGGALEVGIASTAYSARDHDISIIFIRDAITSANPEVHRVFMESVFPRFGLVRTTDWFVTKLGGRRRKA